MEIKNDLNIQDFAEAEKITPARPHGFFWYQYFVSRFTLILLCLLGGFFLWLAVATGINRVHSPGAVWRSLASLAVVAAFFGGKIRAMWNNRYGKAVQREAAYSYRAFERIQVDPDGLRLISALRPPEFRGWSQFSGFREGKRIFLLIETGSHQELLVPKTAMTENQEQEARSLLLQSVGQW